MPKLNSNSLMQGRKFKEGFENSSVQAEDLDNLISDYISAEKDLADAISNKETCESTARENAILQSYTRHSPGCINSNNITSEYLNNTTPGECAAHCESVEGCNSFEYGVYHGGSVNIAPGTCRPQSANYTNDNCNGTHYNLDLYDKTGTINTDSIEENCMGPVISARNKLDDINTKYINDRNAFFSAREEPENNIINQLSTARLYSNKLADDIKTTNNQIKQHVDINNTIDSVKAKEINISAEYDDSNLIIKSQQMQYLAQFLLLLTIVAILFFLLKENNNNRLVNYTLIIILLIGLYLIAKIIFDKIFRY